MSGAHSVASPREYCQSGRTADDLRQVHPGHARPLGNAVLIEAQVQRQRPQSPPDPDAARSHRRYKENPIPLAYNGFCVVDYKVPDGGDAKILEITPRLGCTLLRPEHLSQLREAIACLPVGCLALLLMLLSPSSRRGWERGLRTILDMTS